ncbi:Dolichyl-phosphate-mannose-protein mannosyltransferase [uncultured archaeon]|nr:Dolichyl-phosphate-mannose-protein mannosyltransferase [uncultured archaeon]
MEIDKNEALLLGIVLLIAGVFFFNNIPPDMGDDAITDGISAMLINRAHDTGMSAYDVFKEASQSAESGGRMLSPAAFKFMGIGTPFWTALLAIAQKLFGVTSFWQLFLASLVGFLTVIVTFYAGKTLYGRTVGFLSALLLGSSLFFVIQTRTASGFLAIAPLMAVLAAYLFYTAHKTKDRKYLWYCGLTLGLSFFNGYPLSFLIVPILGFFLLWNFKFRSVLRNFTKVRRIWKESIDGGEESALLGLRDYLLMVLIAVFLFVALTVAWSMYANIPPSDTYNEISGPRTVGQLRLNSFDAIISQKGTGYFGLTWLPQTTEWKIATEKRSWIVIFLEMDPWDSLQGVHDQQQLAGRPMVAPFATIFFFAGILAMLWRRLMADKLCLVWLGVTKFSFTFPSGFVPRALMIAAPVIYLTAAVGLVSSFQILEKKIESTYRNEEKVRRVLPLLFTAGLLFTVYMTYGEVFHEYYGMDANIDRYVGTNEVGKYIGENSNANDTIIVMGDVMAVPYDGIFLYTSGKPYKVLYWWDDVLFGKLGGRGASGTIAPGLNEWEKKVLKNNSEIIYVFASGARYNKIPGWNLYNQAPWGEFEELHPGLSPVKRTYFSNGIPASVVYVVNRSTPRNNYLTLRSKPDSEFYSSSDDNISFIKIRGGGKNYSISVGNSSFTLPMDVPPGMEVSISFDKNSRILFEPIFESNDFEKDIFYQKNLTYTTAGDRSFLEMNSTSADLVYKIESPFRIERLDIRTNPRVFNDIKRLNAISAYYSSDNKEYKRLYEVRSNGNNNWINYHDQVTGNTWDNGIYDRETYQVIYPESNIVYIKFHFEGYPGEAQLWSKREGNHWLMFDARVDTSSMEKPEVKKGLNTIRTHLAVQGEVTIAMENANIMPKLLEAAFLPSSTGVLEGNPSSGMVRRANASIHPAGYIVYGPGIPLYAAGIYNASFRMAVLNNTIKENVARIEVVEGSHVLEEKEIKGNDFSKTSEYQNFNLKFNTDGKKDMQYRVFFERGEGLWVDFIDVSKE